MRFLKLLWGAIASTFSSSTANEEQAIARLKVRMQCVGPDGRVKWEDPRPCVPWWTDRGQALVVAGLAFLALCLKRPEVLLLFPMRVTTAGLNALLDSTLKTGATTPTWYVGLIKAIAADGAITSGAAVLTSASNPFAAGDAGRAIIVRGAGPGGADLATTILNYTNAGSVTLATNASTTVTGAAFAFEPRAADTMASHSFVESAAYSNANRPTWTAGAVANGSVDNSASPAAFTINGSDFIFGAFLTNNNTKSGTLGTLYGGGMNSSGIARQVASGDTLNVTVTPSATS